MVETKAAIAEFEVVKAKAEELAAAHTSLEQLQSEQSDGSAQLEAIGAELEASTAAKESLEAIRISGDASATSAEAEHAALPQAKTDLEAIKTETDALEAAQNQALAGAEAKIQALEEKSSRVGTRLSEVDELKHTNEEKANKATLLCAPDTSSKSNGSAQRRSASVSWDDLRLLHKVHNAKMHDFEAEHEQTISSKRRQAR